MKVTSMPSWQSDLSATVKDKNIQVCKNLLLSMAFAYPILTMTSGLAVVYLGLSSWHLLVAWKKFT